MRQKNGRVATTAKRPCFSVLKTGLLTFAVKKRLLALGSPDGQPIGQRILGRGFYVRRCRLFGMLRGGMVKRKGSGGGRASFAPRILKRGYAQGKDGATLARLTGNRQAANLDNKALIINRPEELGRRLENTHNVYYVKSNARFCNQNGKGFCRLCRFHITLLGQYGYRTDRSTKPD